jgi:hypothetical protein
MILSLAAVCSWPNMIDRERIPLSVLHRQRDSAVGTEAVSFPPELFPRILVSAPCHTPIIPLQRFVPLTRGLSLLLVWPD